MAFLGIGLEYEKRKIGRPKRRWLDRVTGDIKVGGGFKYTTMLHGGVCHCTSSPNESGNMM